MILYLYFNFERVLDTMEREMIAIREGLALSTTDGASDLISPAVFGSREGSFVAATPLRLKRTISEVERPKSKWRRCRRPFFWFSIAVLVILVIDAALEGTIEKSVLGSTHWVALRVLDLILSISVFMQSRKLENLLDEKEENFLQQGYEKGRLTSPFLQMRRKQLMLISYSYLAANML
jgi:hypothetical protein